MADDFVPPVDPSRTPYDVEPSVYASTMGDGYEISRGKGINTHRIVATLEWDILSFTDADTIETYFRTLEGANFTYTLPASSTEREWRLVSWSRTDGGPGPTLASMTARLREQFVP